MNWTEVKKELSSMEQKDLVKLLGELHRLNPENKRFFTTRFSSSGASLDEYKRLISKAVNPPHFRKCED